jgi:hypothetical protein
MPIATWTITCGHCSRNVAAEIVFIEGVASATLTSANFSVPTNRTLYLRCPSCRQGSVRTPIDPTGRGGQVFPGGMPSTEVTNLPADVAAAWIEARRAHSVGAYTAAEIMCRKILMHLAVDTAGSQPGKSFVAYIDDLQAGNFIMAGLKPVVDQIRNRGNKANHELPASTEQESLTTLTITHHLLTGIYELPALSPQPAVSPSAPSSQVSTP